MYLLDTNLISELTKPAPSPNVTAWLSAQQETPLFLSVITIGEIRQGIARLPDSKRKTTLSAWLNDGLLVEYAQYILPIDLDVVSVWGALTARMIAQGRTMQTMDSFIAATAQTHRLTLVTRNVSDFVDVGVGLVNPWE